MSEQGLSIFDDEPSQKAATDETRIIPRVAPGPATPPPSSSPTTALPVVRKGGYDRAAVDARVQQLTTDAVGVRNALAAANQQIATLEARLNAAEQQIAEAQKPSYAGLGGRASALLRLAEEEADEIRAEAARDAAEILDQAKRDGAAIRAEAAREADDARSVQLKELDEARERLVAQAQQERALAQAESDDILAAARREAEQLRMAAEQHSTEQRTAAQREVEQARAAADREVQEARRMLAVEKERLAREATDFHSTKLAESRQLVEEAEGRANAAEERLRIATAQIAEQRAAAQSESESLLLRARREAEQILSSARTQAESIATSGHAEAERKLASIKSEVNRLGKRRDAITSQLSALTDLISGFGEDEDDEAGAPAETGTAADAAPAAPAAGATTPSRATSKGLS